jgi:hypothetical protein
MRSVVWALGALLIGCGGEPLTVGFEQPLRISGAQFLEGELPGLPPLTADDVNAGVMAKAPNVSGLSLGNAIINQGEAGRAFSGSASKDSLSIGVRLEGLGSGYWVIPTGSPDESDGLQWRFRAAFGRGLAPGTHQLLLAGLDAEGRSGNQLSVNLCILPDVPDNGAACIPDVSPPALVVSMAWDAAVDLDLRVVTPTGKVVDAKHPTTADPDDDGKVNPAGSDVGTIDHDAFAGCSGSDGRGAENLVFQTTPPPGTYLVYACGAPSVAFDVSLHTPSTDEDGKERLVETFHQSAQLSALEADGGAKLGTYVTAFVVE